MFDHGVNTAANLPSLMNRDLIEVQGTRLSEIVIKTLKKTLPLELFLTIKSDIGLCDAISYMCEDHTDLPNIADTALNSEVKNHQLGEFKKKTFHGFNMGAFQTKLSAEQVECIDSNPILREWYRNSLMQAIEDSKTSIMGRWYRQLMLSVSEKNSGANAGLHSGDVNVGTSMNPLPLNVDTVDKYFRTLVRVIKQMPMGTTLNNTYNMTYDDMYIFTHPYVEDILMGSPRFNEYRYTGDCNMCNFYSSTFNGSPYGILPITSYCVDTRKCQSGGVDYNVVPVLFGRRYRGAVGFLRFNTKTFTDPSGDSHFFKAKFYHRLDVYDCRYFGISWVRLELDSLNPVQGC